MTSNVVALTGLPLNPGLRDANALNGREKP
jgi:hypothetical protein